MTESVLFVFPTLANKSLSNQTPTTPRPPFLDTAIALVLLAGERDGDGILGLWYHNATGKRSLSMASLIRPAATLRQLNIPGVDCLVVRWAPYHAYSMNAERILQTPAHPRYEQSQRRWQSRTDPFWWNCLISTKVGGKKRVVRNWLARRARVAIADALKRKGYAKNGARLPGESVGEDLVGSANFLVDYRMLRTTFENLQHQADLVILEIVRRKALDDHSGKKGSKPSRASIGGAKSQNRSFRNVIK